MIIKHIMHEYVGFTLDLKDVDLTGNKIIGLVGANGSGKTTLMSILAGFIKANRFFDVQDYKRDQMMFIPSDVGLYDTLSVYDFVQVVSQYSTKKLEPMILLEKLQLTDKKDEKLIFLSEGMRKKLTLITLFTEDYHFLILDEPFNSVDMSYVRDLKNQIKNLAKNTTILISSHILDTLSDLCDEFIYLSDGSLVKQFANTDAGVLERELFQES